MSASIPSFPPTSPATYAAPLPNAPVTSGGTETPAATNTTAAKETVLMRVKAILSGIAADIEHDEQAVVAWIKARL